MFDPIKVTAVVVAVVVVVAVAEVTPWQLTLVTTRPVNEVISGRFLGKAWRAFLRQVMSVVSLVLANVLTGLLEGWLVRGALCFVHTWTERMARGEDSRVMTVFVFCVVVIAVYGTTSGCKIC